MPDDADDELMFAGMKFHTGACVDPCETAELDQIQKSMDDFIADWAAARIKAVMQYGKEATWYSFFRDFDARYIAEIVEEPQKAIALCMYLMHSAVEAGIPMGENDNDQI